MKAVEVRDYELSLNTEFAKSAADHGPGTTATTCTMYNDAFPGPECRYRTHDRPSNTVYFAFSVPWWASVN